MKKIITVVSLLLCQNIFCADNSEEPETLAILANLDADFDVNNFNFEIDSEQTNTQQPLMQDAMLANIGNPLNDTTESLFPAIFPEEDLTYQDTSENSLGLTLEEQTSILSTLHNPEQQLTPVRHTSTTTNTIIHKKQFPCTYPECNRIVTTNARLQEHMRSHTGERPFACTYPECVYRAQRKDLLKEHMNAHWGIKNFRCDDPKCTYATNSHSALVTHKRQHTGEKPYACDFPGCPHAAITNSALTRHKHTHNDIRAFPCPDPTCPYAAKTRENLKEHLLHKHSDRRDFACDICNKYTGKTPSDLLKHKKTHNKKTPIKRKRHDSTDHESNHESEE